jgi:predicted amidohydrolase
MFDVDLPNGEKYRESRTYMPGSKAVLADLPWGKLGITICYDLRFPHLYRTLAKAGASMLAIPSAFAVPTGEAHWHTLMRARAIESGCYVMAAAQAGTHETGRKTFGHSLVVAPWGEVIAEAKESVPAVVLAELDMAAVAAARGKVPSIDHDRAFDLVTAPMPVSLDTSKVVA